MARGTRGRAYDNVPKVLSRRRKLQDARAGVVALERSASNRSMGSMGSMGSFGSSSSSSNKRMTPRLSLIPEADADVGFASSRYRSSSINGNGNGNAIGFGNAEGTASSASAPNVNVSRNNNTGTSTWNTNSNTNSNTNTNTNTNTNRDIHIQSTPGDSQMFSARDGLPVNGMYEKEKEIVDSIRSRSRSQSQSQSPTPKGRSDARDGFSNNNSNSNSNSNIPTSQRSPQTRNSHYASTNANSNTNANISPTGTMSESGSFAFAYELGDIDSDKDKDNDNDLSDQGHQGQDQDQETLGDDGNDKPKDRENSPTAVKSASAVKSRERSVEKTKPNNNNNKPNNNKPNNNKPKERENSPVKSIVKSRSVKKEKEDKEEREKGKEGQYKDQQKEKEDKEERRVEPAPSAEVVTDPVKVALLAMSPGFITDAVRMKELRFLDTNYANVSVSEFANSTSEGVEHLCTDFSTARGWNCILEMFFSIIYLDYSWFQRDYFYTNYGGKEWFFNKATKKGFIERFFDWEGDVVIMPLDERVSLGSYISILLASYLMWSGILDSSHVLLSYPTMTIA